jgi:hypothetical protein
MNDNSSNPFENAPVIFAYTRAQALADGVLVELSEARNFGFKLQVVCTERVWRSLVMDRQEPHRTVGQRVREGALLRAAFLAAKAKIAMERAGVPDPQPDRLDFYVAAEIDGERKDVQLYMLIHPDDDGSFKPCGTIMFPDED